MHFLFKIILLTGNDYTNNYQKDNALQIKSIDVDYYKLLYRLKFYEKKFTYDSRILLSNLSCYLKNNHNAINNAIDILLQNCYEAIAENKSSKNTSDHINEQFNEQFNERFNKYFNETSIYPNNCYKECYSKLLVFFTYSAYSVYSKEKKSMEDSMRSSFLKLTSNFNMSNKSLEHDVCRLFNIAIKKIDCDAKPYKYEAGK